MLALKRGNEGMKLYKLFFFRGFISWIPHANGQKKNSPPIDWSILWSFKSGGIGKGQSHVEGQDVATGWGNAASKQVFFPAEYRFFNLGKQLVGLNVECFFCLYILATYFCWLFWSTHPKKLFRAAPFFLDFVSFFCILSDEIHFCSSPKRRFVRWNCVCLHWSLKEVAFFYGKRRVGLSGA